MPQVVSKGLITGRPAFSNGGLGLSIGSGVGGIRNAIARRAPDGIKIGNSSGNNSGFSFVVNNFQNRNVSYDNINIITFAFIDFSPTVGQVGETYSVFQNKKSVAISSGLSINQSNMNFFEYSLNVSSFAKNVTSNSFDIIFPIISGIDDLVSTDLINLGPDIKGLKYQLSGNVLMLKNNLSIPDVLASSQFAVIFVFPPTAGLEYIKDNLRFYSGKTFKYQLNSNDSGVVTYKNVSIPFVKTTNKSLLPPSLSRSAFFPGHHTLSRFNKGKKKQQFNGGIRNAIARKAPDGIKIENSNNLSLSVASRANLSFDTRGRKDYSIGGGPSFYFVKVPGQFGKKYPVFQNRKSILIGNCTIPNINVVFVLCVSRHATNVTSNSFEITFPIISGIDKLNSTNISDNIIKYKRLGPSGPLVLNNSLTKEQLTTSSQFTVEFGGIGTLTLNAWKIALRFYSGKTIKYKLNTNNNGVIKYNDVTIPFISMPIGG
jgi:hypothetical protein